MRDMNAVNNKKIVNKESGEVRYVTGIDEENRKIFSVPADQLDAEPVTMAAATYDRRWKLYEEPAAEVETETPIAETEAPAQETLAGFEETLAGFEETPDEPESESPAEETPKAPDAETPAEETEDKPAEETPVERDAETTTAETPTESKPTTAEAEINPADPMRMGETITALETIFDKLNAIYFEGALPRPVITVQTTPKAYGHCSTKKIWKHENEAMYEINLGVEFINRPKENTCATLLHEMVHLYCAENEIQDTCQKGRYHNKTFKAECEARDLEVEYDRTNGYAHTSPTEDFKKKLSDAGVDLEVRFARILPKAKAKAEREKAHRYFCPCCEQELRTTADLSLICGLCEVPMERED